MVILKIGDYMGFVVVFVIFFLCVVTALDNHRDGNIIKRAYTDFKTNIWPNLISKFRR